MKKLLKWVKKESGRLEKDHGKYQDQDKQIFACAIKLGEEYKITPFNKIFIKI